MPESNDRDAPKRSFPERLAGWLAWQRQRLDDKVTDYRIVAQRNIIDQGGFSFNTNSSAITVRARRFLARGEYEAEEIQLARRHLRPDDAVIELGAGIGVVSCVVNSLLRDPSKHLSLEANAEVLRLLADNRRRNGREFEIVQAALGYADDRMVTFGASADNFCGGGVGRGAEKWLHVPSVRLGELIQRIGVSPVFLIMDIEGMEVDLITNESEVLAEYVRCISMETHRNKVGTERFERALETLHQIGFERVDELNAVEVWKNSAF